MKNFNFLIFRNDKVTSQEAYEILYEMNGVFKYLIEKLGSIKN